MKRVYPGLVLFLALGIAPAAPVRAIEIHVRIYAREIQVDSGLALAVLEAKLWDSSGVLKAFAQSTADASGNGWLELPAGAALMPGDHLQVRENATSHDLPAVPAITLASVNPRTDLVAGRIIPRRDQVQVHVEGVRLTVAGAAPAVHDQFVASAADGTFRAALAPFDLRRLDEVSVGYLEGAFLVYRRQGAPGVETILGTNLAFLSGASGGNYAVELLNPRGRVRARSSVHVGDFMATGPQTVEFHRASGAPVAINGGDRIRVIGRWGFTDLVGPLALEIDPVADTSLVRARPGSVLMVAVQGLQVYREADATGQVLVDWADLGHDVLYGDRGVVGTLDPQGNLEQVERQALGP